MGQNIMIKKGIIPAAGFGTRLYPATKAFKKEFFPVIDKDGKTKPVILLIIEELLTAGIEEIGIIIQKRDQELFHDFFKTLPNSELWPKLSAANQEYSHYLLELGDKITFIIQDQQQGYGHAVFCAKKWLEDHPFLLSLGDHVYRSNINISCSQQLVNIYKKTQKNVISLTTMPAKIIHKAGIITGVWQEKYSLLSISKIAEKPTLDYARSHLQTEGIAKDEFLAVFGLYILTPKIFDHLETGIKASKEEKEEIQLTPYLDQLCQDESILGYRVQGKYFDTGMPEFYRQTLMDFA